MKEQKKKNLDVHFAFRRKKKTRKIVFTNFESKSEKKKLFRNKIQKALGEYKTQRSYSNIALLFYS